MRKITSFQRRQNRWTKRCAGPAAGWGCEHDEGLCWNNVDRGFIAWNRRNRRVTRMIERGKIIVKPCVLVPCPPFRSEVLFITSITDGADNADR